MVDPDTTSRPAEPSRSAEPRTPFGRNRPVEQFMGDRPGSVIVKLIFVSLIVGAVMALLGLSPRALIDSALAFFNSIWSMGFEAVREVVSWLLAGAVIVVPVWLVARLLRSRKG